MRISVHFSLVSRAGSTGDLPIRMRLSYDGFRLDVRTGYVCPPDKWDAGTMRMKANATNRYGQRGTDVNRNLSKLEETVLSILARYDLDGKVPEPAVLKSDIDIALGRASASSSSRLTVAEVMERFLDEYPREVSLSSGSEFVYGSVVRRVSGMSIASVVIEELSADDLSAFMCELWDDDIENNTASRILSQLKTIIRWARRKGLYHGTLPEDFCPKIKGAQKKCVNYLEWEEFKVLFNLEVPPDDRRSKKSVIRDSFCFSCCTGLRISDVQALTWDNVHLDAPVPYISLSAKKTLKPTIIELNKYARVILDRRLAHPCTGKMKGRVFGDVTNKRYNAVLREYVVRCNIDRTVRKLSIVSNRVVDCYVKMSEAISSHWGRHTFVVHALSIGIPPTVIMSWTGHSSMDSMKPYIAIAESSKASNMAKFDD